MGPASSGPALIAKGLVRTKIMITTSCLRLRSGGSPIRAGPPEDPLRYDKTSKKQLILSLKTIRMCALPRPDTGWPAPDAGWAGPGPAVEIAGRPRPAGGYPEGVDGSLSGHRGAERLLHEKAPAIL